MSERPTAGQRAMRDEAIFKLHSSGLSERAIARIVGCSRSTVWNVLQAQKAAA